jgi:hypothetical protein
MSCIAGLWWDQARRMCALPSEVSCNPYDIIVNLVKDTSVSSGSALCKGLTCAQAGLGAKNYMKGIPQKPGAL